MGKLISKLFVKKEMKVLILGLDGAGKTTILYRLKLGQVVTATPTVGFNVENIIYKNIKFKIFDIGGNEYIRTLWRHYLTDTQALIYVIDSTDRYRINLARQELHYIIKHGELRNALILIFANKQDIANAMTRHEIEEKLNLSGIRNKKWFLQPSSATFDSGLQDGLIWLASNFD